MRVFINDPTFESSSDKEIISRLYLMGISLETMKKAESIAIDMNKITVFGINCILIEKTRKLGA